MLNPHPFAAYEKINANANLLQYINHIFLLHTTVLTQWSTAKMRHDKLQQLCMTFKFIMLHGGSYVIIKLIYLAYVRSMTSS